MGDRLRESRARCRHHPTWRPLDVLLAVDLFVLLAALLYPLAVLASLTRWAAAPAALSLVAWLLLAYAPLSRRAAGGGPALETPASYTREELRRFGRVDRRRAADLLARVEVDVGAALEGQGLRISTVRWPRRAPLLPGVVIRGAATAVPDARAVVVRCRVRRRGEIADDDDVEYEIDIAS